MFQAREHHIFFNQYPGGWPVEEFLKTYPKNKCSYAHKKGYLENANQKQDSDDDGDDDDQQEEEKGEDKEAESHQWNRGDGWKRDPANQTDDSDIYASEA